MRSYSLTTMASTPPPKSSKKNRFGKALERGFDRFRGAILPSSRSSSPHGPARLGTSTADIPKDTPCVERDRSQDDKSSTRTSFRHLSGADTADEIGEMPGFVGNRSQVAMLSTAHTCSSLPGSNTSDRVNDTSGVVGSCTQDNILLTSFPFPHQTSSRSEPEPSDKRKNAWGVAWNGLETALRVLEKGADACPPLKSVLGWLIACLDLAQVRYGFGFIILFRV